MKNASRKLATFLLAGMASVAQAHGQSKDDTAIFDATALAHTCLNCHSSTVRGANGEHLAIPGIFNRDAETTYQQLVAFKQDTLPPNTTIMNRLVAAFNDDELKAIAEAVTKIKVKE